MRPLFISVVLLLSGLAFATEDDPFLWLEDVSGEQAMTWVKAQNAASTAAIAQGDYAGLHARLKSILDSDARIPYVQKIGGHYYNFWQDAEHERGIWRRTTLEEYRKAAPAWDTVIDLDALSAADATQWTWHGAQCLPPAYQRCIVGLSPGGSDADLKREYDLGTRGWVTDGFSLPEAKSDVAWIDLDHLYVMTDFGPGSLTTSGYAREARVWTRGTPLASATLVYTGQVDDVSAGAWRDLTEGFVRDFVSRSPTFFTSELYQRVGDKLVRVEVPDDAMPMVWREHLLVQLRSDWTVGGTTWPSGALIVADYDKFIAGDRSFSALFTPTPTAALETVVGLRNTIALRILEDVRSEVEILRPGPSGWERRELDGLPKYGSVTLNAVDPYTSDEAWISTADFLTPSTLALRDLSGANAAEPLKALPALFDASGLQVEQHFVTSKDGTRVPYFQISRAKLKKNGKNPTLVYGYGGFEVSLTPNYSAATGAAWLEKGGTYVLANIRGGGEYGPGWHQSALKQNRNRAYEDFAAVAADLTRRKIAKPKHIGAMGGSNGGLLMGNMLVQYPDHFGAIVCQVPLLDMKRYNKLLAGASWMGEYGNPDIPEEWSYIQTFSPYHLARADADYPPVLFVTSTRDDRVHPAHARKMAAKLIDQGHEVHYWENIEGGHGGAANNEQRATLWAMAWTFLWNELN